MVPKQHYRKLYEDFFDDDDIQDDIYDEEIMPDVEEDSIQYDYFCHINSIIPENAMFGKEYLDNIFSQFRHAKISEVKIIKTSLNDCIRDCTETMDINDRDNYCYAFFIKGKLSYNEFMLMYRFLTSTKFLTKIASVNPRIILMKYVDDCIYTYNDWMTYDDSEELEYELLDKLDYHMFGQSRYTLTGITPANIINIANVLLNAPDVHKVAEKLNIKNEDMINKLHLIYGLSKGEYNIKYITDVKWKSNIENDDLYKEMIVANDVDEHHYSFLNLCANNYGSYFSTAIFKLYNDDMPQKIGRCFDLVSNTYELQCFIGEDCLNVIKKKEMTGKLYLVNNDNLVIMFNHNLNVSYEQVTVAYRPILTFDLRHLYNNKQLESIVNFLMMVTNLSKEEILNIYKNR